MAEESGMIIPIGEWVLETACQLLRKLHLQGFSDLQVSVNLSGRQFKQNNFLDQIKLILKKTALDARYLALELTESAIMDEVEKTIVLLNKMKKIGVTILIDDFGTGYSSLNYLKRLPVDKLKIDQSFVQDIPQHADDVAITAAIIALAGKLDLKVIAEGIENEQQFKFLMQHGCDEGQGFFLSKPVDDTQCLELLKRNNQRPFFVPGSVKTD